MSPRASERRARVLVVDDAEGVRSYLASLLELRGYDVDTADDGRRALALLEAGLAPDLVLLDVMMPGLDGIATLRVLRERHPDLPVVMLSVVGRAETIVDAMQRGAADFVNKPFEEVDLLRVLETALRGGAGAEAAADAGEQAEEDESGPAGALWKGASLARIRELLAQVAGTDVSVLIQGESGVGKEVVARAVHELSNRSERPFVKVNCAALPGELLESELFGYEKGAFTGAFGRKPGKFETAHRGTLFLDEIGEMSPAAQAKLLHVLQDGSFTRLGGNHDVHVDVRIVSATNRPLAEMVAARRFREDLYFRLDVVSVQIPPLRERREEIPGLVRWFLRRYASHYGRPAPEISPRLRALLAQHDFPGNIRELENWIKRIVVLGREDAIVDELLARERAASDAGRRFEDLLEEMEARAGELPLKEVGHRASLEAEREAIARVLRLTGWNRKRAAELLGVSYKTLLAKIRETGLREEGA